MTFLRAALVTLAALTCLAAAPAPAPAPAPPVTAAQAQQALTVLQDDAQRTRLIDVLRTIAAATPPPATKPATPEGLADQTIVALSASATELSKQVASAATAAAHTPSLWGWIIATLRDPQGRSDLLAVTWKTVAILGCGLAAEWLLGRLLRRPLRALAAHPTPATKDGPGPNYRHRAIALLYRFPRPWPISGWSC